MDAQSDAAAAPCASAPAVLHHARPLLLPAHLHPGLVRQHGKVGVREGGFRLDKVQEVGRLDVKAQPHLRPVVLVEEVRS